MKWAFALLAVSASADEGSPIAKVISMIGDLQSKVVAEGEAVQKDYAEFSEWCEERSKETMFEIKTAKSEITSLKATIEKENANIQTQTSSIEELAGEIASDESDLKAATDIRKKENSDFVVVEKDLVETIDTIERAVGIIEKQMSGGASMMQIQKAGNVIQALSTMVAAEAISSSDGKKLTALVQASSSSDDDETGAPEPAAYESSGGGVVGVLNDLLEKSQTELESARAKESSDLQNYEMLSQSLTDEIKFANKELDEAKKSKSESEEEVASATGDLGVSTSDLEEDSKTLGGLHHDCMTKANEFETETKSRGEELHALATAKKIVIEATSLAQTAAAVPTDDSFLQLAGSNIKSFKAVKFVREFAKKHKSSALAQLASRMSSTIRFGGKNSADVFAKIKGLITDMITKMESEGEADATEKAFCDKELAETNHKKDNKDAEIEKLSAKLAKMSSESEILKTEVADIQEQLGELVKSQAEMDKMRAQEKSVFDTNSAETEKGLNGIKLALKVLNEYYSKDAAHGSSGGASSGIIGLLEVCESDFSKELAEMTETEESAAHAYESETKENDIAKVMKDQDVKFKTKAAASLDKSVSEYSSDKAGVVTELAAVTEYLKELEGRCIAKAESYGDRKARREEEIAGLKEGLETLNAETGGEPAGEAALVEATPEALVQTHSKVFMSVRSHN